MAPNMVIPHDAIEPIVYKYIEFFLGREFLESIRLNDDERHQHHRNSNSRSSTVGGICNGAISSDDDGSTDSTAVTTDADDDDDNDEPPLKEEILLAPTSTDLFMLLLHRCVRNNRCKIQDFDKELFKWRNRRGETILHWATKQRNTATVQMLLDVGPEDLICRKEFHKQHTALHVATIINCVPIVRVLLEHNDKTLLSRRPNTSLLSSEVSSSIVDILSKKGYTALHYATTFLHEPIVRLLVQYGADASIRCKIKSWTPLRYLVGSYSYRYRQQKVKIATSLIEHQPSIRHHDDSDDGNGFSFNAFYWATEHYSDYRGPIVTMLKAGVDCNISNDKAGGRTPLHIVATRGDNSLVNLLLDYGANPNISDHDGYTPLDIIAGRTYCKAIWDLLLEYGATVLFDTIGQAGRKILEMAIRKRQSESVIWKCLSNFLLNPNFVSPDDGWIPLHWAAQNGLEQTVEYLLDLGADINLQHGKTGQTALHAASSLGNETIITLLYEAQNRQGTLNNDSNITTVASQSLDANIQAKDGSSALHQAILASQTSIIPQLLMIVQVDPNLQNEAGSTALHLAIAAQNERAIRLLLNFQKTNINVQDNDGSNALHLAVGQQNEAFVQLLLQQYRRIDVNLKRSVDGATPLHIASQNGNDSIVQQVLCHQPDLTLLDDHGWTSLQLAVVNGHEAVIRRLLQHVGSTTYLNDIRQAVLNAQQGTQRRTALHLAVRTGNAAIVTLLLRQKSSSSLQDCNGWTALHVASWRNYPDIVDLLLMHGANVRLRNNQGKTAIDLAAAKRNQSILQVLKCS